MSHLPIYVYAPYSGQNWGQATYCSGGAAHTIVGGSGWANPIDIGGGSDGTALKFYASGLVRSIRTTKIPYICANQGLTPWTNGVLVDMYLDLSGTQYLGSLIYGHVKERIGDNLYSSGLWGKQIGKLPPDLCASGQCNCAITTCCSEGIHVHMERKGPVVAVNAFTCWASLTAGSTWLYNFTGV